MMRHDRRYPAFLVFGLSLFAACAPSQAEDSILFTGNDAVTASTLSAVTAQIATAYAFNVPDSVVQGNSVGGSAFSGGASGGFAVNALNQNTGANANTQQGVSVHVEFR